METKPKLVERQYLLPFILITTLFALWGFANDITNPMVAGFQTIMELSAAKASLIQFAFYGGYATMAVPAALFIRRYSYKSGILLGLALYAVGAFLFIPAAAQQSFTFFCFSLYILTFGLAFLETTANPYILSMGAPETATRRLNIAQSFNPLGSITGILLSQYFILGELSSASAAERSAMSPEQLEAMQAHELGAVTGTYMTLGFVLLAILVVMLLVKMPEGRDGGSGGRLKDAFRRLWANKPWRWGVVAQFFYVGAQIGVWSFTIRLVMQELGILEAKAATIYLVSIICFSSARFIFTWLMKWIRPSKLLAVAAVADILLCLAVVLCKGTGWPCVIALIAVSFFMSLMFPTIYGIALGGVGEDAKIGASGLIMAILGGALLTPLQGKISDLFGVNLSYLVPLVCFVVVLAYAWYVVHNSVEKIS